MKTLLRLVTGFHKPLTTLLQTDGVFPAKRYANNYSKLLQPWFEILTRTPKAKGRRRHAFSQPQCRQYNACQVQVATAFLPGDLVFIGCIFSLFLCSVWPLCKHYYPRHIQQTVVSKSLVSYCTNYVKSRTAALKKFVWREPHLLIV